MDASELSPGWLAAAVNRGWIYRDRIGPEWAGVPVSRYYTTRYSHSSPGEWRARLADGQISRNARPSFADDCLKPGDRLAWRRPPWQEAAVPGRWAVVFDDGDLHVIDKPAGLPVLPAGGFLEHTVLRLLERQVAEGRLDGAAGPPRPVHRLGRFTSGLLVCARRSATRAWLSAQLRESTARGSVSPPAELPAAPPTIPDPLHGCGKTYRALVVPGVLRLTPGEPLAITCPISSRPHPRVGRIWCAGPLQPVSSLAARSELRLLERHREADLVEVTIATGRPHQIRIHCAAVGAPLLGDPLYLPGGQARADALPGDGGYRLHAHSLRIRCPDGSLLMLEAPWPHTNRG